MKYKFLCGLAVVLGLISSQVGATNSNVGSYNLILKNDLDTSSDIEGRLIVGGNINMSKKSLDVGSELVADPTVDAVTVVGNITASDVKTATGNIVYGGDIGSTKLINNGGVGVAGISYKEVQSTLQSEFDEIWNSVEADSAYFASLEANAVFDSGDMNHKYLESSSASDLTVYEISTSELLTGDIHFRNTPTVPVVINVDVTGMADLVLNSKVDIQADAIGSLVLWNFFSTDETITDINFSRDGWRGSVLAPYANITSATAALEGGFAALSYTGSVELHNNLYSYTPPTPSTEVPAPMGLLLLGLGLVLMGRKKKTK